MILGYGMVLATIAVVCLIVIAWRTRHFGSSRELYKIKVAIPEPVTLPQGSWRFILSGDSRNCGDVVIPAIEALPDSIAESHSMGDSAAGRTSGQQVYEELEEFRDQSSNADEKHKNIYVLASHSHFYMQNIFDSETLTDEKKKQPLLGWIIGTGGAERYALPLNSPNSAETDVYGYLLATVSAGGTIDFSFQKVNESDVPQWVRQRYPAELVPWCFAHNSKNRNPLAPELTPRCAVPEAATTPISPSSH